MYSDLSNIAHPIEILDLENKLHAIQTCICLNGPANSSVSLGNSSHCIQGKNNLCYERSVSKETAVYKGVKQSWVLLRELKKVK